MLKYFRTWFRFREYICLRTTFEIGAIYENALACKSEAQMGLLKKKKMVKISLHYPLNSNKHVKNTNERADQRIYIINRKDSTLLRLPNICPPNLSLPESMSSVKTWKFETGKKGLSFSVFD